MQQKAEIVPFKKEHQPDIDALMEGIALEFEEPIFSVGAQKIIDVHKLPGNQFWVAMSQDKVIGTIGVIQLADGNLVLKSMFVDRAFRGQGASSLLLNHVISWATENHYKHIFLGTMAQFVGAQKFYGKNGFVQCIPADLPADFIGNTLDTLFYSKRLSDPSINTTVE